MLALSVRSHPPIPATSIQLDILYGLKSILWSPRLLLIPNSPPDPARIPEVGNVEEKVKPRPDHHDASHHLPIARTFRRQSRASPHQHRQQQLAVLSDNPLSQILRNLQVLHASSPQR